MDVAFESHEWIHAFLGMDGINYQQKQLNSYKGKRVSAHKRLHKIAKLFAQIFFWKIRKHVNDGFAKS